MIWRTCL